MTNCPFIWATTETYSKCRIPPPFIAAGQFFSSREASSISHSLISCAAHIRTQPHTFRKIAQRWNAFAEKLSRQNFSKLLSVGRFSLTSTHTPAAGTNSIHQFGWQIIWHTHIHTRTARIWKCVQCVDGMLGIEINSICHMYSHTHRHTHRKCVQIPSG